MIEAKVKRDGTLELLPDTETESIALIWWCDKWRDKMPLFVIRTLTKEERMGKDVQAPNS